MSCYTILVSYLNSSQRDIILAKGMKEQLDSQTEKHTVYYDGSCPMCTVIVNKIDGSSKGEKFSMRDITEDPLPQDFTKDDVEKEIHIVADGKVYKNAEAVLKILEQYPVWKIFAQIGRLPIIKSLLRVGYNLVARNRHFLFGPAARVYWLKVVIALGFISGLLLSLKLWLSSRFYPLTPVIDIPSIPYPVDWIMLVALFGLLVAIILSSKPKRFIWASVILVSLLVFFDQQRLQPWVYQYALMLSVLGLFSWRWNDVEGRDKVLNVSRFIIASIYFYSGLQKISVEFIGGVFPWMIAPAAQLFPDSILPAFYLFGAIVPFIEMGIGIGLMTKKFRSISILGAVAMFGFILLMVGPLGHNWNSVIWPWNVTMATVTVLLFAKTKDVSLRQILWVKNFAFHKIALVVFGVLPFFYFFNAWDSYLSWSLYSGTTNEAVIYMSEEVKEQLPDYVQQFVDVDSSNQNVLSVSRWSFGELNVPPYPETRIFKSAAKSVCAATDSPQEIALAMRGRLSWFNHDGHRILSCDELNGVR